MSRIIEMQPAYLLHSRPFRDSSLILDFLTPDYGRLSAISRGGRGAGSKSKSLLQPFTPVHISLSGKSELKTLRSVELRGGPVSLKGEKLFSALYMNEIIVRLFQSHEADPEFFVNYEEALANLAANQVAEPVLRHFELSLLDTLGYGIDFTSEAHSHDPVVPECWYYFQEESGFILVQDISVVSGNGGAGEGIFRGIDLIHIHNRDFSDAETRKVAKSILRGILNNHLGAAPLRSRSLFKRR